jgi:hypothetical protein
LVRANACAAVSGEDLNAHPVTRPGEILEAVPGLIVTQHSGEGKANQCFLRGYNLDHGTDLAIYVDDMPVNMRTHAHGQGYADLNWLMPETVNSLEIRKGLYFADEGDFSCAGNLHIGLMDSVPKAIAQLTAGGFGYRRFFGIDSVKAGDGTVLVAGEAGTYDGPWINPDDMHKYNGLVRYTQGTALDGLSVTGMAYTNKWNSTDQIPQRATPLIALYGSEDPSDGGNTDRFAVSARVAGTDDAGSWKANGYAVKSQLDLFNDFTYFLRDSVLGDQFHQHDDRVMAGANASRTLDGSFAGLPMQTTFGMQTRYDAINLAVSDTFQRSFLSTVRNDKVGERQRRRACAKYGKVDGLAEDDHRLARRLLRGARQLDFRRQQFWRGCRRHRQSEIHDGGRSLQQDRILRRPRRRHALQRRARRDHHPTDPTTKAVGVAAARPHQRRGNRRAHEGHSGARFLAERVRA